MSQTMQPTVVAVFNQKGGIGKTTTSTNLAVCLAAMGFAVGVIDLDTQGNATSSLGLVPAPAVGANDLLFGDLPVADLFLPTLFPGLTVCGANDLLTSAEIRLSMGKSPQDTLRKRLVSGVTDLDALVIDCPPAFGMLPLNALAAAQRAIMPVTAEPLAHDGLQKAWTNMRRISASLNPGLATPDLVVTMVTGGGSGGEIADRIHGEFGRQVFSTEIPRDAKVIEAAAADLPVCVFDPMSPAARASLRFAIEFVAREQERRGRLSARNDLPWRDFEAVHATLRQWRTKVGPRLPAGGWTGDSGGDPGDEASASGAALPEDWVRETS